MRVGFILVNGFLNDDNEGGVDVGKGDVIRVVVHQIVSGVRVVGGDSQTALEHRLATD